MHISLRVALDATKDRIRIELEPGKVASTMQLKIEGSKKQIDVELDAEGYVLGVSIPGLKEAIAAIAGEKPGKG